MRITYILPTSLLSLALLASCSTREPAPAPKPQPPEVVTPAPPPAPILQPTGDWIDWPLAKGDWVYRTDERGSIALFGPPNGDATFLVRCDRNQNKIFLSRAGNVARGGNMTLRASSGLKNFPARSSGSDAPYAAISLAPDEYILDRIAFSRGRFAVQTSGLMSIAIPIWPEFTRVVEDCRS